MEEEIINSKKPDNYVENAGLLPYGTNVSAPAIKVEDITAWKSNLKGLYYLRASAGETGEKVGIKVEQDKIKDFKIDDTECLACSG